jgi:hypothetical protein
MRWSFSPPVHKNYKLNKIKLSRKKQRAGPKISNVCYTMVKRSAVSLDDRLGKYFIP